MADSLRCCSVMHESDFEMMDPSTAATMNTQNYKTMGEMFSVFNIHGAPADFLTELTALSPARLRAIYLACMPIADDTFDHGCDSDREIWNDAKKLVSRCPVLKTTLADMVLLILARSVF